jgi:hypothetical protein
MEATTVMMRIWFSSSGSSFNCVGVRVRVRVREGVGEGEEGEGVWWCRTHRAAGKHREFDGQGIETERAG